jgi:hypothetical protein
VLHNSDNARYRSLDGEYRLNIYIRIVRLLLEDDDAVTAENFFNRASLLIHDTKNRELQRAWRGSLFSVGGSLTWRSEQSHTSSVKRVSSILSAGLSKPACGIMRLATLSRSMKRRGSRCCQHSPFFPRCTSRADNDDATLF